MKTTIAVVGLLAALLAVSARAQTQAQKPPPEMKAMQVWDGVWKFECELKQSPIDNAEKYSGTLTVRWILGGFFQEWRYLDRRASGTAEAVELNWYDPATKRYPWQGFVSNGTIYSGTTTVDGRSWNWASVIVKGGVEYKTRGVLQVSPDGMSYTEKAEVCSADGKTWLPNFERRATKVRASK